MDGALYNRERRERLREEGRCLTCGQPNPDSDRRTLCPSCLVKARESRRRYLESRPNYQKDYYKRLVAEGRCPSCGKENTEAPQKKHCASCRSKKQDYDVVRYQQGMAPHQQLKREVFAAYGGACCVCCEENHIEFLTLDHVLGGGNEHRLALTGSRTGSRFYRKLKEAGFPNDPPLQVMCLNCNFAKGHGGCPHEVSSGG